MGLDSRNKKHQAQELIERLAPSQVSAVVSLPQAMLDPGAHAIAHAPIDDEPVTDLTVYLARTGQGDIKHLKEVLAGKLLYFLCALCVICAFARIRQERRGDGPVLENSNCTAAPALLLLTAYWESGSLSW